MDRLFSERLDTATYAKLIRIAISNEGYTYTKPYLKRRMPRLTKDERDTLAESINDGAWIYDNIAEIQSNLMQVRRGGVEIDIRRLSMTDLYQAKTLSWCYKYADLLKGRGKKPNNLAYTEEEFNDLVTTVMQHPCFAAVNGDASSVASLGGRLQRTLLNRMRNDF